MKTVPVDKGKYLEIMQMLDAGCAASPCTAPYAETEARYGLSAKERRLIRKGYPQMLEQIGKRANVQKNSREEIERELMLHDEVWTKAERKQAHAWRDNMLNVSRAYAERMSQRTDIELEMIRQTTIVRALRINDHIEAAENRKRYDLCEKLELERRSLTLIRRGAIDEQQRRK